MKINLRPYQKECLETIKSKFSQGLNRQLVHLPTAAGKTVIFSKLIQQLNRKTLVLAHTCELLDQATDKIKMISPDADIGILNADSKNLDNQIVVSSIQSARKPAILEELKKQNFELCIYDEAHRSAASSPKIILSNLGFLDTKKLLVGFSATPFRTDNKGLGEVFQEIVYSKTIKDLIALGFLCSPTGIKIATDLDLSRVKTEGEDFVKTSLASVMNTPQMIEIVINAYIENAINRKTICFAVDVSHAKNLSAAFKNRDITSEAIYEGLSQHERKRLLERFQKGEISVLTNCQILTEGWDCPEVDCVLIAKPTQSKGLYTQMAGRGLRLFPNKKDCLILDFGSQTHSLCSTACLIGDTEEREGKKQNRADDKICDLIRGLPPSINKKLRAAIIQFDPIGECFSWIKEGSSYLLKAVNGKSLKIMPVSDERYNVILIGENQSQVIAKDLSFEYAFSSAEEFAKANRSLFTLNDLEASWRGLPISDKQKDLFRSFGYRSGIEDLSRGQAALIIGSGILNRKAVRR